MKPKRLSLAPRRRIRFVIRLHTCLLRKVFVEPVVTGRGVRREVGTPLAQTSGPTTDFFRREREPACVPKCGHEKSICGGWDANSNGGRNHLVISGGQFRFPASFCSLPCFVLPHILTRSSTQTNERFNCRLGDRRGCCVCLRSLALLPIGPGQYDRQDRRMGG